MGMDMNRRGFMKSACIVGAATALPVTALASFAKPQVALGDDRILDLSHFSPKYLSRCRLHRKDTLRNCKLKMTGCWYSKETHGKRIRFIDCSSNLLRTWMNWGYWLPTQVFIVKSILEDRKNTKHNNITYLDDETGLIKLPDFSTKDLKEEVEAYKGLLKNCPSWIKSRDIKENELAKQILRERAGLC